MTTSGITNINAKLIHQHPDNPRKDLGDLTELSESIKKKGIMQNLTVIPGYWDENAKNARILMAKAQEVYERTHTREEWMKNAGKNYL